MTTVPNDARGSTGREDLTLATIAGERAAFVLPVVGEDLPPAVREGIARRRLTVLEGQCPCGAAFVAPNRAERRRARRNGRALHVAVEHEDGCPAITSTIIEALASARWST